MTIARVTRPSAPALKAAATRRTRRRARRAGNQWNLGEGDRKQRYIEPCHGGRRAGARRCRPAGDHPPLLHLGGTGGGIAYNRAEFFDIVQSGLDASPTTEVLIEESVLGWKEYEMEVVRDKADNCIIICSIENIDPMGVHTGDSITVAPALTLTDKEYQIMRNASIAVLREIGVETGGSNVQFAVNPADGRLVVIEMNPRVSRSSALASKATGFPIAKIAAKLAVGYTLDELENDITGGATPASFEPSIDYVVTKIPRFAFEKFPGAEPMLTTAMKSVGEVMAIGRTFQESLQKALRGLETGLTGLDEIEIPGLGRRRRRPQRHPRRARHADARPAAHGGAGDPHGHSLEDVHADVPHRPVVPRADRRHRRHGSAHPRARPAAGRRKPAHAEGHGLFRRAPRLADRQRAEEVAELRNRLDVRPVYKRIDTCAAEFASPTAYMYSTYETPFAGETRSEAQVSSRKKVVILGGGPNRIGQGIEFDYCCCHAAFALREAGYEAIMVNCNPETVSTDYDTSDRLYFEPLTAEDVMEILRAEQETGELVGVIVQFGGQTPLKLADALEKAGIPILGTSPDMIDLAEDRDRFQKLLQRLDLNQPKNGIAYSVEQARLVAGELGFPLVVRPSYVLGGRAMQIIHDEGMLQTYLLDTVPGLVPEDIKQKYPNDKTGQINTLLGKNPLLFDTYLTGAIEVDVDCLCDGKDVFVSGIMEHIEEAGIHSGDSACSLPVHSLSARDRRRAGAPDRGAGQGAQCRRPDERAVRHQGRHDLRARGQPARLAHRAVRGQDHRQARSPRSPRASWPARRSTMPSPLTAAEAADAEATPATSRSRKRCSRSPASPASTSCSGRKCARPARSWGSTTISRWPSPRASSAPASTCRATARCSSRCATRTRRACCRPCSGWRGIGFRVLATGGTPRFLAENGMTAEKINKVLEGRPHIEDAIRNRQVQLVFNTTDGQKAVSDSKSLRRATLMQKVPYYTTMAGRPRSPKRSRR